MRHLTLKNGSGDSAAGLAGWSPFSAHHHSSPSVPLTQGPASTLVGGGQGGRNLQEQWKGRREAEGPERDRSMEGSQEPLQLSPSHGKNL